MGGDAVRRLSIAALVAALFGVLCFTGIAGADTVGTITFEPPSYSLGSVDGQHGWQMTGPYDVAVASVANYADASGYGFGTQALRISDAVTSGSFGDQAFSPGVASPASESGPHFFDAGFSIGTTSADPQPGLHLSVSPDSGDGSRMSYLRFEDQSDGIHVFFDDATDGGPLGTPASFSDTQIAVLSGTTAHTVRFLIDLQPGAANDVVQIYIDGNLVHTGTSWEDYYRFDPEQAANGNVVPSVDKLLFREAGTPNSGDQGNGFLIDNVSLASENCATTGFHRDGMDLTAAQIGGDVTGPLDATGCNIGVYYGHDNSGTVNGADIHGANYYGVVANAANVDVTNSQIHDIGESPLNGSQHGVGVLYTTVDRPAGSTATGMLSGNTIWNYQKNGVVVSGTGAAAQVLDNTVTGQGPIDYIAQNGIEIASGATAQIKGNTVTGNWYTPKSYVACGLLFYQAGGVKQQGNNLSANEVNLCNAGRGGGNNNP
jgi:parallel beta helix pectate lyase-like protein